MAITVTLYSFTKRENSTKRPSSGGTSYSCVLIDDTSLMNPVFKLDIGSNPIGKNYAHVSDFDRYYFITEVRSYQGFWYISCTCDVMGTYKTQIGAETHYVVRSADEYDGSIMDTFYPTKVEATTIKQVASNPFAWNQGHSYVVGIIGYAPNAAKQTGSVTYYHMNEGCLRAFINYLMADPTQYSGIAVTDYDEGIQKALLNPMQYIVSCIAVPVSPPSTLMNKIRFGYYEWTCSAGYCVALGVDEAYASETAEIVLTKHPQANDRGQYLNCAPYMSYTLHYSPFSDIPLDPAQLVGVDSIQCDLLYDLIKGLVRMIVHPKGDYANRVLYNGSTQIGVNINISQIVKDVTGYTNAVANTIIDTVAGFVHFNPFEAAKGAFNGIESANKTKYPTVSGLGDGGSFLPLFDTNGFYLLATYYQLVDENRAEIGRPLCTPKRIDTLAGYIQCSLADCTISGTYEEAQKVNDYLNTGFFYE